ncbi:hypothetical protein ACUXG4_004549 [Cupriavidus metallidurans]
MIYPAPLNAAGHFPLFNIRRAIMVYTLINPATGLPMTDDGFGGVDVGGNRHSRV